MALKERFLLHELLHGVSLVEAMIEKVRESGENPNTEDFKSVFDKYPELGEAFNKVHDSVFWLYQLIGSGKFKKKKDWRKEGFEKKYLIEKQDGTPVSPNAEYFVLRLDGKDLHHYASREAVRTYARVIAKQNPKFAAELEKWANRSSNNGN